MAIEGLEEADRLLARAGADWPRLIVERRRYDGGRRRPPSLQVAELRFDESGAEIWISDTESIELFTNPLRLVVSTRDRVSDDAVVHPFLALPAAVASRWLGRQLLHGSAFLHGGQAWGILGTKEAGKSSTVAWLAGHGYTVLSDDLLVIDHGRLYAGPRCIDLRKDAASVLGGLPIAVPAGRERWRVRPDEAPGAAHVAGFVYLGWDDEIGVTAQPPATRVPKLIENSVFGPTPADTVAYLDFAALPSWTFNRPRRLDALDRAMEALLAVLG